MIPGNVTCRYSSVDMSPGLDYYIHNCKGPSVPTSVLRKASDHSIMNTLESNESKLKMDAAIKTPIGTVCSYCRKKIKIRIA